MKFNHLLLFKIIFFCPAVHLTSRSLPVFYVAISYLRTIASILTLYCMLVNRNSRNILIQFTLHFSNSIKFQNLPFDLLRFLFQLIVLIHFYYSAESIEISSSSRILSLMHNIHCIDGKRLEIGLEIL